MHDDDLREFAVNCKLLVRAVVAENEGRVRRVRSSMIRFTAVGQVLVDQLRSRRRLQHDTELHVFQGMPPLRGLIQGSHFNYFY